MDRNGVREEIFCPECRRYVKPHKFDYKEGVCSECVEKIDRLDWEQEVSKEGYKPLYYKY